MGVFVCYSSEIHIPRLDGIFWVLFGSQNVQKVGDFTGYTSDKENTRLTNILHGTTLKDEPDVVVVKLVTDDKDSREPPFRKLDSEP